MRASLAWVIAVTAFGALVGADQTQPRPIVLVVHGGAGALPRAMSPEDEHERRATLERALAAGQDVLAKGGASVDAVERAILVLEDSPLFNAGKGAVLTRDGRAELDAAIMRGDTLAAGAVASVTTIRNPIRAARAVMERSATAKEPGGSVLLVGPGAERYAAQNGLDIVDPAYFRTEKREQELQRFLQSARQGARIDDVPHFGTVGAVALDRQGNLAAGTSTGGRTGKRPGRVGDSPLIGAGTYADNRACAVSATGTGEFFIRHVIAYDLVAQMRYAGVPLDKAASTAIFDTLHKGDGGLIAVDAHGNIAMPFSTPAMFRGYVRGNEKPQVAILQDE